MSGHRCLNKFTPIFWQSRTITISTYLSLFGTLGVLILANYAAEVLYKCSGIHTGISDFAHLSSISSDPQTPLQTMVHNCYLHFTNYENITGLLNGLMDSQKIELCSHILEHLMMIV